MLLRPLCTCAQGGGMCIYPHSIYPPYTPDPQVSIETSGGIPPRIPLILKCRSRHMGGAGGGRGLKKGPFLGSPFFDPLAGRGQKRGEF